MKKIFFLFCVSCVTSQLFAWGQTGHRVIAQVAQNHLSESCAKQIEAIMGYESLVEASTWMDEIKSDSAYNYTHAWHYVTIPDGETYQTSKKSDFGDVYEAIGRMKDILKNPNKSKEEKRDAIRMLTHLIGDIHQPLHVGNGKDRGGNKIRVKWFNKPTNLHRIWDSAMIDNKQFIYSELAQLIDHPIESTAVNYSSTDLDLWVQEAIELRPQLYQFPADNALNYTYLYENWDTVKDQLAKAGIRLAAVLNEIYTF